MWHPALVHHSMIATTKLCNSLAGMKSRPGICHYYTVEETQRRCFSGRFTLQKQVELWEDTYEVDDGEIVAGRVSAYSSAGGSGRSGGVSRRTHSLRQILSAGW